MTDTTQAMRDALETIAATPQTNDCMFGCKGTIDNMRESARDAVEALPSPCEGPGLPVEAFVGPDEMQAKLAEFARQAGFYRANHLEKACDEIAELKGSPRDPAEMADVVLAVMLHADTVGVDLMDACRQKLWVVMQRRYGVPDSRGVVRHLVTPSTPRYDTVFTEGMEWLDKEKTR